MICIYPGCEPTFVSDTSRQISDVEVFESDQIEVSLLIREISALTI